MALIIGLWQSAASVGLAGMAAVCRGCARQWLNGRVQRAIGKNRAIVIISYSRHATPDPPAQATRTRTGPRTLIFWCVRIESARQSRGAVSLENPRPIYSHHRKAPARSTRHAASLLTQTQRCSHSRTTYTHDRTIPRVQRDVRTARASVTESRNCSIPASRMAVG